MSAHLLDNKLVIGISSRALFNLDESHRIFEQEGVEAYREYQVAHEDDILPPGDAFPLVKKLLAINQYLKNDRVEVILLSRNTSDTGLRVFNSIEHFKLKILLFDTSICYKCRYFSIPFLNIYIYIYIFYFLIYLKMSVL